MTGFDPAAETHEGLAQLSALKSQRGADLPPPPRRRPATEEAVGIEAFTPEPLTVDKATTGEEVRPTMMPVTDVVEAQIASAVAKPTRLAPASTATEQPSPVKRIPPSIARFRNTSAELPQSLLDDLEIHVLTEAAAGRRFIVRDRVEAALMDLPVHASTLVRHLERHQSRLNWQLRPSDPTYKASGRFGIRVSEDAVQRIAKLQLELRRNGKSASKQDLLGLSIIFSLGSGNL